MFVNFEGSLMSVIQKMLYFTTLKTTISKFYKSKLQSIKHGRLCLPGPRILQNIKDYAIINLEVQLILTISKNAE